MPLKPPPARLRPLLNISYQLFDEGYTPGEIELELALHHGCNAQNLAEVVPPFRVLHRDRTLQNGTYLSWWRQIKEDPLYTGAAGVSLLLITVPTTLWLAYKIQAGLGFSNHRGKATEVLAFAVACLGAGVSWVLGFPLFLLTRAHWQQRAAQVRRWLAVGSESLQG